MENLFLIGWFLCGIISFVMMSVFVMRNEEYNERRFKREGISLVGFLLITMLGVTSLVSVIIISLIEISENRENRHSFMKLLYKITNIGIKKDKNGGAKNNESCAD